LRDAVQAHLSTLPDGATIVLKLTIPAEPGLYPGLAADPRVLRVLALSGGYSRDEACPLLTNSSMVASSSRALLEGLSDGQTDDEFTNRLDSSVAQIYRASMH
jgi:fructose-bisphosphate aldolase class I